MIEQTKGQTTGRHTPKAREGFSETLRSSLFQANGNASSSHGTGFMMKTIRQAMTPLKVWVNPTHTVATAIILLKGHQLPGLPVLQGDAVVGMVDDTCLLNANPDRLVQEVMRTDFISLTYGTPVRQAAQWMEQNQIGVLPVVENGELQGLVSVYSLLPEIGRSYDPMTGLPWSDVLRAWSVDRLKEGQEITILFFDLDNFGAFNKRHGHLVGDEVLQILAQTISQETDPEMDVVCRWGGDEFAVATLRRRDEAGLLAHQISRLIATTRLEGVDIPLSISYGYYGGKRTREREQVHYEATVDNLVNLASQECMKMKGTVNRGSQLTLPLPTSMEGAAERRAQLQSVSYIRESKRARAQVYLRIQDNLISGVADGEPQDETLIAQATLQALNRMLPKEAEVQILGVAFNSMNERSMVSVLAQWELGEEQRELIGSAIVGEDQHRAIAIATLDALNRHLSSQSHSSSKK